MYVFTQLSFVVDKTLEETQETIDVAASLAVALEREDDALLRLATQNAGTERGVLQSDRRQFDDALNRLARLNMDRAEAEAAEALEQDALAYRAASDSMLTQVGRPDLWENYRLHVNPALRRCVADCGRLRELNFRRMSHAGVQARDGARRATVVVGGVLLATLLISTFVTFQLEHAVVPPIRALTTSVGALRLGNFESRVAVVGRDELGQLASGFNQMADALSEFHRSNLGEVLRAKKTFEATLAALKDAVIVVDPEGGIIAVNAVAATVLQALGKSAVSRVDELPLPQSAISGALGSGPHSQPRADLSQAFSVLLADREHKLLPTIAPIPNFRDGRNGAVVVLYDVTEYVRLDELRTEMIAVASHELKTPLTTLQMNLLLLRERLADLPVDLRVVLTTAIQGSEELATTIDELLDLNRIEAGQLRLSIDRVDVPSLIEHCVRKLRPRFDENGIEVAHGSQGGPAALRGDAARLGMVLSNLLTNALKYTPRGGTVAIRASLGAAPLPNQPPRLQISVSDTGCGIPPEYRGRVFEKFFRLEHVDGHASHGVQGVGIGLYLCKQIVALHGGTIYCTAGEDGGARFVIELPCFLETTAAAQPFGMSCARS
jgi:NtrC-family two-component system sensor histidine kinase KinB